MASNLEESAARALELASSIKFCIKFSNALATKTWIGKEREILSKVA